MGIVKATKNIKSKGAYEWARKTVNCCTGCSNDCRYCYARQMAVRFGQVTNDQWSQSRVREHDVNTKHRNYGNMVLFPSSHDITKENLGPCRTVLRNLLAAGNEVLIVTKPDPACIQEICKDCYEYRDRVLFRFTIGALDNSLLKRWEPGAPSFEDRYMCLRYTFESGFQTSVSIEPMIDADNVVELMGVLLPYVTDTIWLGKMNYLMRVLTMFPDMEDAVHQVWESQTDDKILRIYNRLKNIPVIRWKESIRKVVEKRG